MKKSSRFKSLRLSALVAGMLVATASSSLAQDYTIDTFGLPDDALLWNKWWGNAPQTYEFDYSVDAKNDAASGSLKVTIEFDLASYGGENQFAVLRNFPTGETVDGTRYTNLVFDLRWDTTSAKNAAGNFGYLEYGFRNLDWSQTWLGGTTVPASADGWIQIVAPIDPTLAKLDTVAGVVLKLWSGGNGGLTGTTMFWVDNVKLVAKTETAPPPPPTLALAPVTPGLRLAASAAGQQYQRQNIRTLATDADGNPNYYSWVGNTAPVTYSLTIKEFPDASHNGFQAHMILAPENSLPYGPGDASVDWNAANVVFIQIANNADGTATGNFMYKTNLPSGNSMFWNSDPANGAVGSLASLADASARGTWSVTFKNNTDITLTTPSGTSTNFAMPAEAAALFADPIFAYFGVQPNNTNNIGQSAIFSRVQITGVAAPLDDSFTAVALDQAKWGVAAADAPGVSQVPPNGLYWLRWNAPATGFVAQASPTLVPSAWSDAGLTNVVQVGAQKMVLVTRDTLPGSSSGFFRLVKP